MTQPCLSTPSPHHSISGDTFLLCVRHRWQLKYLGHLSEHMWLCVCVCVGTGARVLLPLVATRMTSISRLITAQEGKNSSRRTMASIRTSNLSETKEKGFMRWISCEEAHPAGFDKTDFFYMFCWGFPSFILSDMMIICDGGECTASVHEGEGVLGVSNHVLSLSYIQFVLWRTKTFLKLNVWLLNAQTS